MTGGAGIDVFVFDFDGFKDTMTDFEDGIDLIGLDGITFEDLDIKLKKSEVVSSSPDGDQMILANVNDPTHITVDDFLVT